MDTIETLKKLKETITHQLNTGFPVQFSDLDLSALLTVIEESEATRTLLWSAFGGPTRYGDDGELQGRGMDFKRTPLLELLPQIGIYHKQIVHNLQKQSNIHFTNYEEYFYKHKHMTERANDASVLLPLVYAFLNKATSANRDVAADFMFQAISNYIKEGKKG